MNRLLAPALTLLLALAALSLAGPRPVAAMTIELSRADDGNWVATYRSPQAFDSLTFSRSISAIRHPDWRADGGRWQREGTRETLVLDAPRTELTVHIPQRVETLVRDYELIRPFSDSSAALYTGHLDARASAGGHEVQAGPVSFRFLPRSGEAVVVGGRQHLVPLDWRDAHGAGHYVYFGAIQPLAGEHVLALVDPGLPVWAGERLRALIPSLFDYFDRLYGASGEGRPTVLFSFQGDGGGGLESGGGALPGQLQMFLKGDRWFQEDTTTREQLDYLLAHEAAHLWNHTGVHNRDAEHASWLHEGGADAMTHRALEDLGRIDGDRRGRLIERQLNVCLGGLGQRGLAAIAGSEFQLHYACGEVIYRIVEAASGDLAGFIESLLARAEASGGYGLAEFLALVGDLDPAMAEAFQALAGDSAVDPAALLGRAARRAGLALKATSTIPDPHFARQLAVNGLAHLMGQACGGRFSLNQLPDGVRFLSIEDCEGFEEAFEVRVVNGLSIQDDGARVHDALVSACGGAGALTLDDGKGASRTLSCRLALQPRGPYWRLVEPAPAGAG